MTEGLIEVEKLTMIVLFDDPLQSGHCALRLAGYSGSRIPWGVRVGGPDPRRFFKDLRLQPVPGGRGYRLDLACTELLTLGLGLERELDRHARYHQGQVREQVCLPKLGPAVRFTVAAGTLSVKARSADIAVEHRLPTAAADETLWLPFEFLDDCSGKRDEPVRIEATGKGRVTVQWRDGSVPQIVQYDSTVPPDADKFPSPPETFTENPPGLLKALDDARDTTDPAPTRFAMDCVQWCGATGSLAASDGRHLLVQSGYQFPWQEDLLVPGSRVFGSPELPQDAPVRVGKTGNWVAIAVEQWTIYLAVNVDGRFPDVVRHIPSAAEARACCSFSAADARFLAETLPRLPCDDDGNRAVTLDLNGHVAIRAKPSDSTRPTEVVLIGSSFSGEPIRVNTNRNYLARAMRLGLRELSITGSETALACSDEYRQYVWMPLSPESAIPPATDTIRIESPSAGVETPATQPQTRRRVSPVSLFPKSWPLARRKWLE